MQMSINETILREAMTVAPAADARTREGLEEWLIQTRCVVQKYRDKTYSYQWLATSVAYGFQDSTAKIFLGFSGNASQWAAFRVALAVFALKIQGGRAEGDSQERLIDHLILSVDESLWRKADALLVQSLCHGEV